MLLDALNLLFLGAVMASDVTLYSDTDYMFHTGAADRDSVTVVSTHREWWRADGNGKCKYTGLMVPYVRDWPEVIKRKDGETILPPEPDKTAGQAFIFNKKVCAGKPDEAIFRVGSVPRNFGGFLELHQVVAQDVNGMKVEDRPKWFNQVLQRVERVSLNDRNAKDFLDYAANAVRSINATKGSQKKSGQSKTPNNPS